MEELPRVIGRCSPETKVRMIEAHHRRKKFAAMSEYFIYIVCRRF